MSDTYTVNREDFLRQLESVAPGLSKREIVEQSSCFVFDQGRVITFNDEITCQHKCDLALTGAVQAEPLLAILRRMSEEEVTISVIEGHLKVSGKKKDACIRMEATVLLNLESYEVPKGWKPLPAEFMEAIDLVQQTASNDQQRFAQTCVHITPTFIESTDNFQITRYKLTTGFDSNVLVRRDSVKNATALGMTHFSETKNWLHFKNKLGLVYSCRRHSGEDFPDVGTHLKVKGTKIVLPKGLGEAAEKAAIFSSENVNAGNDIKVTLRSGKLKIEGQGSNGWYREIKSVDYDGPEFSFMMTPKLLGDLSAKHSNCLINERVLMVDGGSWRYVTCLGSIPETEESK